MCLGCIWGLFGMCLGSLSSVIGVCLKCVWDVFEVCLGWAGRTEKRKGEWAKPDLRSQNVNSHNQSDFHLNSAPAGEKEKGVPRP